MATDKESKDTAKGGGQTGPPVKAAATHPPLSTSVSEVPKGGMLREILTKHMSAFVTALIVTGIGIYSDHALDERAKHERRLASEAQNYRLYTELLSKREDSESALRKDMFNAILKEFFIKDPQDDFELSVAKRLLKLEMLALNFGESLSLSPLFVELDKDILRIGQGDKDIPRLRSRLRTLAKRVAQQHISALSTGGEIMTISFPLKDVEGNKEVEWPEKEEDQTIACEGIPRTYRFFFSEANSDERKVTVELDILDEGAGADSGGIHRKFGLDFFNFPMVDNTRLSHDQRFALVLTKFDKTTGRVGATGICFSGKYSSQRDKPFLDDVIHRLHEQQQVKSAD